MGKLESDYQAELKEKLKKLFPGCYIFKVERRQGIPDLVILFGDQWAMLEVKRSRSAPEQPNQRYHVRALDDMSFADFIYPENEAEVLREMEYAFGTRRPPRFPRT
ncbi:MAG: hypothetical protein ACWGQW_04575 [bacterium]